MDSLNSAYQLNQTQNQDDEPRVADPLEAPNDHIPRQDDKYDPNSIREGFFARPPGLTFNHVNVDPQDRETNIRPAAAQFIHPLEPVAYRQPAQPLKSPNLAEQYKHLAEGALNKELSNLQQQMAQASLRLKDIMDSQRGNP